MVNFLWLLQWNHFPELSWTQGSCINVYRIWINPDQYVVLQVNQVISLIMENRLIKQQRPPGLLSHSVVGVYLKGKRIFMRSVLRQLWHSIMKHRGQVRVRRGLYEQQWTRKADCSDIVAALEDEKEHALSGLVILAHGSALSLLITEHSTYGRVMSLLGMKKWDKSFCFVSVWFCIFIYFNFSSVSGCSLVSTCAYIPNPYLCWSLSRCPSLKDRGK